MNCYILYLYVVLSLYIVGGYGAIIMTVSSKIPPKEFMQSMSSQYGYVYASSTFFIPTTEPPTSTTTSLRTLLTPLSLKTPPVDTRVKPTPPSDYTRKVTTTTTTTTVKITALPIVTNSNYSYHFGTPRSSPPKTIPGKTANITTTITTTITNIQTTVPIPIPTTVLTTVPTTVNIPMTTISSKITTITTTSSKPLTLIPVVITDISQLSNTIKSNTKAVITNTSAAKVPGTTPTKVVTAPITYMGTIPTSTSRTYNNKSTKNTKVVPSEAKTVPLSSTASSSTKSIVMTTTTTTTNNPPPQTTTQAPQENCVEKYGQCGGKGYNGPTCCVSGTTCHAYNEYYSQCILA